MIYVASISALAFFFAICSVIAILGEIRDALRSTYKVEERRESREQAIFGDRH